MNLRQMPAWGKSASPPEPEIPSVKRCLTLLAEGAALSMPEIDQPAYKVFRESVTVLSRQIRDGLPESDSLPLVREILREFESYRKDADGAIRERQAGWRSLTSTLLHELIGLLGIDAKSGTAAPLMQKIADLSTGEQIQVFRGLLEDFLHPGGNRLTERASPFKVADRSTANDNAAGLRGGGAAKQYVEEMLDRKAVGFVVLFRLSCLDVIGERFGLEAVHDSLMAVSAFLTQNLRGKDPVYHWSDSSLLAVLESDATEQMVAAAMQRIVNSNRDITIRVGDRNVMLRIPLIFEMIPLSRLRNADDLLKLSRAPSAR